MQQAQILSVHLNEYKAKEQGIKTCLKKEPGKYLSNGASWKAGLNKSILDAGWGMFLNILSYKASEQGKKILSVNPRQTSQICNNCGCIVPKTLSVRTHICPECGFRANRDYNAALNILRLGLQSLRTSELSGAW